MLKEVKVETFSKDFGLIFYFNRIIVLFQHYFTLLSHRGLE